MAAGITAGVVTPAAVPPAMVIREAAIVAEAAMVAATPGTDTAAKRASHG